MVVIIEEESGVEEESDSLFDKLDPSNLSFTEEPTIAGTKEPTSLKVDVERAKKDPLKDQDLAQRQARTTPSSAIFPQDAAGMRPLGGCFEKFYAPKGFETDPDGIRSK